MRPDGKRRRLYEMFPPAAASLPLAGKCPAAPGDPIGSAKNRGEEGSGVVSVVKTDAYSKTARLYDPLIGPLIMPVRREICRLALGRNLHSILDICCGTGRQSMMLQNLGFRVTGLDLSPAMLRVAQRKAGKSIPFVRGDAARLPFADDSFDAAVISFALHEKEVSLCNGILREAKRVVRQPVRLIVADFLVPLGLTARAVGRWVRLVERGAGKEHYASFLAFMKRGGLTAVLLQQDLRVLREERLFFDNVAVVLAGH